MTDADRFEAFVREYQDMVFATAVRLLANPTEAEDIAQTVFLRAFERFSSIGTSATAAGWLKTVTTNLCLNHLARYRARWQFFSELDRPGDERYETTLAAASNDALQSRFHSFSLRKPPSNKIHTFPLNLLLVGIFSLTWPESILFFATVACSAACCKPTAFRYSISLSTCKSKSVK